MNAPMKISDLPGPRGLPILGNALQVDTTRLHLTAEQWSRKYGEYYRFRLGRRTLMVVANPEAIATMLRDRPEGFQRTSRLSASAQAMGFGGVFSSNGERWRRQRPMVMAGFDPAHIKSYFPALVRVPQRFQGRWRRAATAGSAIELQSDLMRYTVDVTAGLAFGADINTLESDDEVIQRHLDKVLPALFKRLMSPFPFLHRPSRALRGHLRALQVAVDGFISQARSRMAHDPALPAHPTTLIEVLLAAECAAANALAWMTDLLSPSPHALRRARDEVRAVVGAEGLPPRYEQASALAFVEACANETMRLKPVAPIIVNEAVRDSVVAGIEVPKGQLVMCLMRPGATDARHLPDAPALDPARWLSEGARAAGSSKRVAMPFGAGPRLCPGRYLAMLEIKMVIAMLLGSFDIDSVRTPDGEEAREHLALTMSPVGLVLKLKK